MTSKTLQGHCIKLKRKKERKEKQNSVSKMKSMTTTVILKMTAKSHSGITYLFSLVNSGFSIKM